MTTHSGKARILIPLTLAIAVLLGTFIFGFYRSRRIHTANGVVNSLEAVEALFESQLKSDATMMGAVLHVLRRDEKITAAMRDGDRKTLFEHTIGLFGELNSEHGITHLYFTGPDRVNLLRVHKPDKHGDEIKRLTTLQAEKTGKTSYGIELGPLGTFTLRVVEPWYDGEELIGYVELGEEIEHITQSLHDTLGVELYVVIDKKFLDREGWETGMRMLGRDARWNRFPTVVIIDQTLAEFPDPLVPFLDEEYHTSKVTDVKVSLNDRHYRSRFIHLSDVSGQGVGDMVVMKDVTNIVSGFWNTVFLVGAVCIAVGAILFVFYYTFIGRNRKVVDKQ
jgi:hypothetical protein